MIVASNPDIPDTKMRSLLPPLAIGHDSPLGSRGAPLLLPAGAISPLVTKGVRPRAGGTGSSLAHYGDEGVTWGEGGAGEGTGEPPGELRGGGGAEECHGEGE